jgi:hypothetical protein
MDIEATVTSATDKELKLRAKWPLVWLQAPALRLPVRSASRLRSRGKFGVGHWRQRLFTGMFGGNPGKCQDYYLTPKGWRCMGDLAVGDPVTCPDGTVAPILGVYPQGSKRTASWQASKLARCSLIAERRRSISINRSWSKKENGSSKSLPAAAPVKAIHCAPDVTHAPGGYRHSC